MITDFASFIDKADGELGGYLQRVFGGISGRAGDFVPMVKLFMTALGFENIASERSFYRMKEHNLVSEEQFFDFSSSYFDRN